MKFKDYIDENISGKVIDTLTNMVAISRKQEDIDYVRGIIKRALEEKFIKPVHANRLNKELDYLEKRI